MVVSLAILAVLMGFPLATIAGGGACAPSFSSGCAKHISFDSSSGFQSSAGVFKASTTVSVTPGDLIVVEAVGQEAFNGVSHIAIPQNVTDTAGDIYQKRVEQINFQPGLSNDGIDGQLWTAFTTNMAPASLTITTVVNGSGTDNVAILASTYRNVIGVGSTNSSTTSSIGVNSANLNITTIGSQSIIVGGLATENTVCPTNPVTPGVNLTQRVSVCGIPNKTIDMQDSFGNWEVPTNRVFFYQDTVVSSGSFVMLALELSPGFVGLPNLCTKANIGTGLCPVTDADTFCPTTGDSCHINAVGFATKPAVANRALLPNTLYCTGITTGALTTTVASPLILLGSYGGVDLNVTGATNPKLLVTVNVGTSAPTTVFGLGSCGTTNPVGTSSIYFAISGALSPATVFSTAINGWCAIGVCSSPGTFYAWIDITPLNFSGHMNYDQITSTATQALATLTMIQKN